MKRIRTASVSLILVGLLAAAAAAGGTVIFDPGGSAVAIDSQAPYKPSPLLPATLIDSWDTTPEYNWGLNADFAWANVFDTNDITGPHTLTTIEYHGAPTLGVTYEFWMTTDNGGWPDDANLTLLAVRSDLDVGGVFQWMTIDVSAAGYVVDPGQKYWLVRTCPVGGWPGFTWSSATNLAPPENPPVKITQTFPSGGWGNWVTDWWMMFRIYGDPAGGFTLDVTPDPLQGGQNGTFAVTGGQPNSNTWLAYSLVGPGSTYVPALQVTVDLASPARGAGPSMTDGNGDYTWTLPVPPVGPRNIWLQAVQFGQVTNMVATSVQ